MPKPSTRYLEGYQARQLFREHLQTLRDQGIRVVFDTAKAHDAVYYNFLKRRSIVVLETFNTPRISSELYQNLSKT